MLRILTLNLFFSRSLQVFTIVFPCLFFIGNLSAIAQQQHEEPQLKKVGPLDEIKSLKLKNPVVVELFSSQACPFCPQADKFFASLSEHENFIGLACHVTHFEVKGESLAQEFCTERQNKYSESYRIDSLFTPQIVINGRKSVVGYEKESVTEALRVQSEKKLARIEIRPQTENVFAFILPGLGGGKSYKLWVALRDKPQKLQAIGGSGKQQDVLYKDIVSALISPTKWDGTQQIIELKIQLEKENKGFVLLAQDQENGAIVGAGVYDREES